MNVERAVLRTAVGHDNYPHVERFASLLEELEARGVIGAAGREGITEAFAWAIVAKGMLDELGSDLSLSPAEGDTPTPEDPPT
jgi:hypothetical protein